MTIRELAERQADTNTAIGAGKRPLTELQPCGLDRRRNEQKEADTTQAVCYDCRVPDRPIRAIV